MPPKGSKDSLQQEFLESDWLKEKFEAVPNEGPIFLELVAQFNRHKNQYGVSGLVANLPHTDIEAVSQVCDTILSTVLVIATLEQRHCCKKGEEVNIESLFNHPKIDLESKQTQYDALAVTLKTLPDLASRFTLYLTLLVEHCYILYFHNLRAECKSIRQLLLQAHAICEKLPKEFREPLKDKARAKSNSHHNQLTLAKINQQAQEQTDYDALRTQIYERLLQNSFSLLQHAYQLLLKDSAIKYGEVDIEKMTKKALSKARCDARDFDVQKDKELLKEFVVNFYDWLCVLDDKKIGSPKQFISDTYNEICNFIRIYWPIVNEPRLLLQLVYSFHCNKPSQKQLCEQALDSAANQKKYHISSELFAYYFSDRFSNGHSSFFGFVVNFFHPAETESERAKIYESIFKELFTSGNLTGFPKAIKDMRALSNSYVGEDFSLTVLKQTEYALFHM